MNLFLLQCSYVAQQACSGNHVSYVLPLVIVCIIYLLYLAAALKQEKRSRSYKRIIFFTIGCALLVISFSPPVADYAHHHFTGHTIQHLLLAMLAPLGLVLGAPVTLALRTLPVPAAGAISKLLRSPFFHFISHPVTALLLNIGGMFCLYLTPLYNLMHEDNLVHALVHFHFFAAGYLFIWSIAGPDPAPRRPKMLLRTTVLFLSMAAHAYLSKFMYAYSYPKTSLHSEAAIKEGAKWMYYGGDVAELLLVIALFALWYNRSGKPYYRFSAS